MDGIVVALLLTQVTAYTAYITELTGIGSTVLVGADNDDIRVVGNGDNDLTGTGFYALHTAGRTGDGSMSCMSCEKNDE